MKTKYTTYKNIWDTDKQCLEGNLQWYMHILKKKKDLTSSISTLRKLKKKCKPKTNGRKQ